MSTSTEQTRLQKAAELYKSCQEEIARLESDRADLTEQLSKSKQTITDLEEKLKKYVNLGEKYFEQAEEIDILTTQIEALQTTIDELSTEKEAQAERLKKAATILKQKEETITEQTETIDALQQNQSNLVTKMLNLLKDFE